MLDNVFYLRKSYLSCRRFEIMHSFLILKTNYILFYHQSLFKCHSVPGACAVDRIVCSGKARTGPGRSSLRTGSRWRDSQCSSIKSLSVPRSRLEWLQIDTLSSLQSRRVHYGSTERDTNRRRRTAKWTHSRELELSISSWRCLWLISMSVSEEEIFSWFVILWCRKWQKTSPVPTEHMIQSKAGQWRRFVCLLSCCSISGYIFRTIFPNRR